VNGDEDLYHEVLGWLTPAFDNPGLFWGQNQDRSWVLLDPRDPEHEPRIHRQRSYQELMDARRRILEQLMNVGGLSTPLADILSGMGDAR